MSFRPTKSHNVRLRIHHSGELVHTSIKWYVDGEASELNWKWDVDVLFQKQENKLRARKMEDACICLIEFLDHEAEREQTTFPFLKCLIPESVLIN